MISPPLFPSALRHLYVLAVEGRTVIARETDDLEPCHVPLTVRLRDSDGGKSACSRDGGSTPVILSATDKRHFLFVKLTSKKGACEPFGCCLPSAAE